MHMPIVKSKPVLGFAGLLVASLITALDAVALAVSLPTIATSLHLTTTAAYWSATIFVLTSAAFQPLFPSFSNVLGRRAVTLFALILFLIGTVICGAAQNAVSLLVGRGIQGVGCGGCLAIMYVVLSDLWGLRERARMFSINGLIWLVGLSAGPVIGGALCMHAGKEGWRWIFWMCLPLTVIAMVLVGTFLDIPLPSTTSAPTITIAERKASAAAFGNFDIPEIFTHPEDPEPTITTTTSSSSSLGWKNVDYIGALLLVTSLTAFLVPLTWGGVQYSWTSLHTLLPLLLSLVLLPLWILWTIHRTRQNHTALIPLRILTESRTSSISFFNTLIMGMIHFGLIFYLTLYFQIAKSYSPIISGVCILPQTLLGGPINFLTGIIITKTNKYKLLTLIGWGFTAVGCALLVLLNQHTTIPQWIFINCSSGIGLGILINAVAIASQAEVKPADAAIAAGLSPFVRALGQALGISVCNAVLSNSFKHTLISSTNTLLRNNADAIISNFSSLDALSLLNPTDKEDLLNAFCAAMHNVWWLLFGLSVLAGVLTLATRQVDLDRNEDGNDDEHTRPVSSASASDLESGKSSGWSTPRKSVEIVTVVVEKQ